MLIIPSGTDHSEKSDGVWVGLISANLQELFFTITASTGFVFGLKSPALIFFFFGGGGGGGITGGGDSTVAILILTLATI